MKRKFQPSDEEEDEEVYSEDERGGGSEEEEDDEKGLDDYYGEEEDGEESGEDEEEDDSEDEEEIREQLADIPFEVLEKIREDGHVAGPPRKKSTGDMLGGRQRGEGAGKASTSGRFDKNDAKQQHSAPEEKKVFKRENKNRPVEMSSKRPVGRFREVVAGAKKKVRDPRFEALAGQDKDQFRRRYSFLFDEQLPAEKRELEAQLKREKNPGKKERLKLAIQRIDSQIRSEVETRKKEALERGLREKEKQAVREGKRPFYLKESDKKQLLLVEKFKELKKAGRLDKYLEKKRKHNASKDHKFLPSGRRGAGGD